MNGSEFSKSLLKSSKIDAPLPNAKTRALAHVEHAMKGATTAANAVATSANAVTSAKLVYSVAAAAVLAGAAGMGGGYTLAHLSPQSQPVSVESREPVSSEPSVVNGVAQPAMKTNAVIAAASNSVSPAASAEPAPAADSCKVANAESSGKCSVSGGHTVTFAVKSECSQAHLDVFWVDESCREIYRGMLAPSDLFWQDSWEGHVFRLRDHTTHQLVKEITASPIGGAPDRTKLWKGPPTEEPVVAIGDENKPIAEAPPSECAHGGGRAAVWHFQNDRKTEPIAITWVDGRCREGLTRIVDPGKKLEERLSEGHAFRIRDASGALLMDVPPTSLDTTTYLTVP